mgnify:CR=1 FL=1
MGTGLSPPDLASLFTDSIQPVSARSPARPVDRMIGDLTAMASALAESFDDACRKARQAFNEADEKRKLNPPPLPPHACAGVIDLVRGHG